MKRWLLVGSSVVALAGCGQPQREGSMESGRSEPVATDMAAPSGGAQRAPGIDVTAAPGVAFAYNWGFRLPSDQVDEVQEAHAKACENLGPARCRITGMRYRLIGENNVEGEIAFKLAPALARGFGKDGAAVVERAGGRTVDIEITGTDAGSQAGRADTDRARAEAEVRRLDAAIARARSGTERAQLQAQRDEYVRQVTAAADTGTAARESLATTPVTFRYGSGPAVRGFDTSAPITSALDTAVGSAQVTLAVVLALLAIFGPPALIAALVWWAIVTIRRRRRARVAVPVAAAEQPPTP